MISEKSQFAFKMYCVCTYIVHNLFHLSRNGSLYIGYKLRTFYSSCISYFWYNDTWQILPNMIFEIVIYYHNKIFLQEFSSSL